jgi:hypothetical protein
VARRLPNIEKILKNSESLTFVLFCRKYVINPAKLEKRIMNVLVSTAMLIGIKKSSVMIETKKTPPPIPAIEEIIPERSPSNNSIETT